MQLVFTGGEFIFRCKHISREIPRNAGFTFDNERRVWMTRRLGVAHRLRQYADGKAKNIINRSLIRYKPWSGELPHPKHLKPYDYQKDPAATFALSRSSSYLALAPRLGKTIVSALVINALKQPAVFITPPFLTRNIEAEFKAWLTQKPRIARYDAQVSLAHDYDILIVPDSLIHRPECREEIFRMGDICRRIGLCPTLFVDEAHRYTNPKALRTQSLLGHKNTRSLINAFDKRVFLSGTPMRGRPMELYPLLSKVAPETIDFMSMDEYGMEYCAGYNMEEICPKCRNIPRKYCYYCKGQGKFEHGYDFSGASNLEKLQEKVHGKFMLRMKTVKGLPPRVEELVVIGPNPPKLIAMEQKILAEHSPEDLVSGEVDSEHVATYRRELGMLKVKSSVDFIRSLLEDSDESILVFAFHRDVVKTLSEKLKKFKPMVIQGGLSNDDRFEIEKTFQSDKTRRLIIANYIAAGLGLRLSRADRVVMVEFSWTPTENEQASDRANAVNSGKDELFVQYLIFENSLDRKTMEVNLRKRKTTSYI